MQSEPLNFESERIETEKSVKPLTNGALCLSCGRRSRKNSCERMTAGNLIQQSIHGAIKFFVSVIKHLQLVIVIRLTLGVELSKAEILHVLNRAFLAAHEFSVVIDP